MSVCEHCGHVPGSEGLVTTSLDIARARATLYENDRERIEEGIIEALNAYALDDGNAAEAGHALACSIRQLLPPGLRPSKPEEAP